MNATSRLATWSCALLLAVAAPAGWAGWEHAGCRRATKRLVSLRRECDRLAGLVPAPTATTEVANAAQIARLQERGRAWMNQWDQDPVVAAGEPSAPVEAMVTTAKFIQSAHEAAARACVVVKRDEAFGYRRYATHVAEPSGVAQLHRDRAAAQNAVRLVLAAEPAEIAGMRRGVDGPSLRAAEAADEFTQPGVLSLRSCGWSQTSMHAIEFVGETRSLRRLLCSIATATQPVAVRSVSVEPMVRATLLWRAQGPGRLNPPDGRKPATARFTIVLEQLSLTRDGGASKP